MLDGCGIQKGGSREPCVAIRPYGASGEKLWKNASLEDTGYRRVQMSSFCSGARNAIRAFSPIRSDSTPNAGGKTLFDRAKFPVSHIFLLVEVRAFAWVHPSP